MLLSETPGIMTKRACACNSGHLSESYFLCPPNRKKIKRMALNRGSEVECFAFVGGDRGVAASQNSGLNQIWRGLRVRSSRLSAAPFGSPAQARTYSHG